MLKQLNDMATKKIVDVRDLITEHLKQIKRPLSWIAKPNTSIPYGSVYSIFEQKVMELSEARLNELNAYLDTDFTLPE